MRSKRLLVALTVATAAVVGVPAAADAAPKPKPDVPVQLIAMNDFHGRIQNTSGGDALLFVNDGGPGPDGKYGNVVNGVDDDGSILVGGAANVASTVKQLQASFAKASGTKSGSYFVGAGDLISASPYESSVFKDEPTIEVLDAMGLDVSSVGNHEFDRGTQELRRISGATDGTFTDNVTACQGVVVGETGCFGTGEHAFDGADFPYLAANVVSKKTGKPMLPPYQVFDIPGGKKVALIGVVTKTTPGIVSPDGIADVNFIDEATAVNKYVPELTRRGVQAIGVLIHEGGTQSGATNAYNGCDTLTGPIVDINNRINDEVDLIVSAHTHQAYNCQLAVPGGQKRLVTSAGYYGRLVSDIRLTLDAKTGEVNRAKTYQATNVPVARNNPDAGVQAVVDYWLARSKEAGNKVIGQITADIKRAYVTKPDPKTGQPVVTEDRESESSLGNLIAQTQFEATQQAQFGFPVIAFMNPGGLRTDLLYAGSPAGEGDGNVTYKEIFDVLPFGNTVGAVTLTGAQVKNVLEQQFIARPPRAQLILGTNDGFRYDYDLSAPVGSKVSNITLNGTPIDPAASYRVAAPNFLIAGGDQFSAFKEGTNVVTGPVDVDAAVAYFAKNSPVAPPAVNHTRKIG